ncbi:MAG: putative toxin-antitoxin system toxin component, PIN family [bacterium]
MKAGASPVRAVFDTNVLLSILGFPGGRLDALWGLVQEGAVEISVSSFILDELARNLTVKAKLTVKEAALAVDTVRGHARLVVPAVQVKAIRTPEKDNRILECAVEAGADVLVTGDRKHIRPLDRFQGIAILEPREFLDKHFPDR